jgi:hypothetical protein
MRNIFLLLLRGGFAQYNSYTTTETLTSLTTWTETLPSPSPVLESLDFIALANNLLHKFYERQEVCLFNNGTQKSVQVIACCATFCDDNSIGKKLLTSNPADLD